MPKLNKRSEWLLRYAYSLQPRSLYMFGKLPVDAPPGVTMANVRGLERAGLLKQTKGAPYLFEVTEEGALWIQDHPER